MKRLLEITAYCEDVKRVARLSLPWERLSGKTVLISGGTGLIGSFLIDVLYEAGVGVRILLLGRSKAKAQVRFQEYWDSDFIKFVQWDGVSIGDAGIEGCQLDFILHLASNTHPVAYATDPIGTITANVLALNNLLELACRCQSPTTRPVFLFASSNEIYGENRGDVEFFDESYCGYIDCNTLRAGYPESKRCGEALCQAYAKQRGLEVLIARLTRTYGPTALSDDSKAINQFFRNSLRNEDIVLKSEGRQHYSFLQVADSVSGLLTVLLKGAAGEAYNIADEHNDVTLRDLAKLIAEQSGRKVVFDLPNAVEAAGFSKATKARLGGEKIRGLGWAPYFNTETGVKRTMEIYRQMIG